MVSRDEINQRNEKERLRERQERSYFPKIRAAKNHFTEQAAENYARNGVAFTEDQLAEFILRVESISITEVGKVVAQTGALVSRTLQEPPRPNLYSLVARNYLDQFGLARSREASLTTSRDIVAAIQQGLTEELPERGIIDSILEVKTINRARALTIARTEVGLASSAAEKEIADNIVAESRDEFVKTWLTAQDPRVRDIHAEVNDVTIPYHGLFQVGPDNMHGPRDPMASPGNVINCRCSLAITRVGR